MKTSPRLLVIDDEDYICRLLQMFFTRMELFTDTASSIQEGMKHLTNHDYDLVIMDVHLQEGKSTPHIPEIKEQQPDAKIIVISGAASETDIEEALSAGGDTFVPKPFELEELKATVEEIIEM
ncbi:response regulator [Limibacter armeniacum]|uniref:response regulator n=1 Tax=Limibacter armeniacum TaxID=466084 RepID=UPI002FE5F59D